MPAHQFLPWVFFYGCGYSSDVLATELQVHVNTLRSWRFWLQNPFAWDLTIGVPLTRKIVDGLGIRVQIDASHLLRAKPQSAPFGRACAAQIRAGEQQARWVWGAQEGAERDAGGQCVIILLDADLDQPCGAAALRQALLENVAAGSRIIHDDWGAYRALDWESLPFLHDARSVVNHSKDIKNIYGENTNHIEGVWGSLKRWLRFRCHGQLPRWARILEGYIVEFLWRQCHAFDKTAVIAALCALMREYGNTNADPCTPHADNDSDRD